MKSCYAVIMAGGVGSRFWPLSRIERPKQFLSILGDKALLKETVDRIKSEIPPERILILTSNLLVERSRHLLPELPAENIIGEPMGRNTAPCLALAARILLKRDPEATMIVLSADHFIGDAEEFLCSLDRAVEAARGGHLVTLGVAPTRPETGYGYIQHAEEELAPGIYPVKTFAEKPDLETALNFLKSGDFLWNSGMFIWENQAIVEAFEEWMPELWEAFDEFNADPLAGEFNEELAKIYPNLRSQSIDVGIMEPAGLVKGKVRVIRATFPWNDVGTWAEVHRMMKADADGNTVQGQSLMIDSRDCHVHGDERMVVLLGMESTVVVDTPDALLVCPISRNQDLREVINRLKAEGNHELL